MWVVKVCVCVYVGGESLCVCVGGESLLIRLGMCQKPHQTLKESGHFGARHPLNVFIHTLATMFQC